MSTNTLTHMNNTTIQQLLDRFANNRNLCTVISHIASLPECDTTSNKGHFAIKLMQAARELNFAACEAHINYGYALANDRKENA